jgi:hypothetical protein
VGASGTLTTTVPSGEGALIQNIGKVLKVHGSNGSIMVTGAGRTNATPNLNDGNIFIGNSSNQATTGSLDTLVGDEGYVKLGTTSTTALAGNTSIPSALTDLSITDGTNGQVLTTNGSGSFTFSNAPGGDLVDDTTPQLGGNLDLNSKNITGTGSIDITGKISTDTGFQVDAAFPYITLKETDTTNLNTRIQNQGGVFEVITTNDAGSSETARLSINHSTGVAFFNGNITLIGGATVDGRTVSTDGTKLDTIATNADVTPSWVPSSNPGYITGYTVTESDVTAHEAALDIATSQLTGNIDLTSQVTGLLPVSNMAATALTTVQTAASEAAQLALTAQEGDVVVRSDENKTYMHNSGSAGTMADFTLLATPTDSVTSVNGNTGAVTVTVPTATSHLTNDSGFITSADGGNATTLDSIDSSSFLRSDVDDTMTGQLTISGSSPQMKFNDTTSGEDDFWFHINNSNFYVLTDRDDNGSWDGSYPLQLTNSNSTITSYGNTVWTSGNDGSGSTLDADKLDGYHANTTRNSANTIPIRDGNGYLQLGWINTTSGATTATLDRIYASSDGYIRYVTPATLGSQLGQHISYSDLTDKPTIPGNPAITSNGSTPSLASGITAAEVRTLIGAGTSSSNNATHTGEVTGSGALTIAADVVDAGNLKVTGNGTATQFLRSDGDGTFTWATPTDTNTTYSVGDNGLTEKNFTSALKTKLEGIASSATNTAAPAISTNGTTPSLASGITAAEIRSLIGAGTSSSNNATHTGEVTGSGALTIAADVVDAGNLKVTGNGTATQFLRSDGDGTFTWATPTDTNTTYSVGDGGLTTKDFTAALKTKLEGIASSATNTAAPAISTNGTTPSLASGITAAEVRSLIGAGTSSSNNATHTGEVTGSGALTIAADVVDAGNLKVTGNGTATQFLRSDGDGSFTWATPTDTNTTYSVGDNGLTEKNFTSTLKTKLDNIAANATNTAAPAITTNGTTPSLSSGITGAEVRSLIGAGTSSTDTNTTYTAGTGMSLSGTTFNCTVVNTDTNTTYTADGNYGMTLSGTAFRLENDRRRNSTTDDVYSGNTHDYTFYDADVGIRWYTAGAEEMRLEDDGDLHVDGNITAYSATVSDKRLKSDIKVIDNALEKVKSLGGYTFTYHKDEKKSAGVIAQEVEKVLPSAVKETKLPFHGKENEVYKTVEYDQLVGLLIESVKELTERVEELEKKLGE